MGDKIVFWGRGCDTQGVLPLGTPKIVEKEVKKRIKDLAPNGFSSSLKFIIFN